MKSLILENTILRKMMVITAIFLIYREIIEDRMKETKNKELPL